MKNILSCISVLLLIIALSSCKVKEGEISMDNSGFGSIINVERTGKSLSNIQNYDVFLTLSNHDSYDEILNKLGEPVVDPTLGIPFLIYEVFDPENKNETIMIQLSFDFSSNLSSIEQIDQEGKVVKSIRDYTKDGE